MADTQITNQEINDYIDDLENKVEKFKINPNGKGISTISSWNVKLTQISPTTGKPILLDGELIVGTYKSDDVMQVKSQFEGIVSANGDNIATRISVEYIDNNTTKTKEYDARALFILADDKLIASKAVGSENKETGETNINAKLLVKHQDINLTANGNYYKANENSPTKVNDGNILIVETKNSETIKTLADISFSGSIDKKSQTISGKMNGAIDGVGITNINGEFNAKNHIRDNGTTLDIRNSLNISTKDSKDAIKLDGTTLFSIDNPNINRNKNYEILSDNKIKVSNFKEVTGNGELIINGNNNDKIDLYADVSGKKGDNTDITAQTNIKYDINKETIKANLTANGEIPVLATVDLNISGTQSIKDGFKPALGEIIENGTTGSKKIFGILPVEQYSGKKIREDLNLDKIENAAEAIDIAKKEGRIDKVIADAEKIKGEFGEIIKAASHPEELVDGSINVDNIELKYADINFGDGWERDRYKAYIKENIKGSLSECGVSGGDECHNDDKTAITMNSKENNRQIN